MDYSDSPLYMDEDHIKDLVDTFKSLFDSSIDNYVCVNREGYLENSICLLGMESDVNDPDYDSSINSMMVTNLDGLTVERYESMKSLFNYQGQRVLMRQYLNYRCDEITFIFTKLTREQNAHFESNGLDC